MIARADEHIRARCFHPSGKFIEFPKEDVETTIPERFEKIVRMYPNRMALKMGEHVLSYTELNEAADRVARTILATRGANPEPVALLIEDRIQRVIGLLGALKAGKYYVPLDPSFPRSRIAAVLTDSGAGLLLTDKRATSLTSTLENYALSLIDIEALSSTGVPEGTPSLSLSPDALACISYTSGSTGRPKGVVQSHRNVLHWAMVHTNNLHICKDDRLSLLQSYSVPSCIHNLFGAILNGAALFPFDPQSGAVRLAKWLVDEEITVYHSVPMIFRQLAEALTETGKFPALRVIRLSGAPTTRREVLLYKKYFSDNCILVQVMGTTEAGTVPHYFLDTSTELEGISVPVGYAEPDAEIILLDENRRKVGAGQVGEIAVKSRYLAPGYWRNAELTETKFLRDPLGGEKRIYLTGDLGRMNSDGCLFHLGRKDFQVNVRGYRVEVGEVEAALSSLEWVEAAVVGSQPDGEGNQRLVAYVVPAAGQTASQSAIRCALDQILPSYMIPSAFVFLENLPLLPNGKVDRKALPAPDRSRPRLDVAYVAPRSSTEQKLVQIWSDILSLDQIGIHDNFFESGGHSLAATQVVSRIIKEFQYEIPLRALFQSPTVAETAKIITEHQNKMLGETELQDILTELESLSEEDAMRIVSEASTLPK